MLTFKKYPIKMKTERPLQNNCFPEHSCTNSLHISFHIYALYSSDLHPNKLSFEKKQ